MKFIQSHLDVENNKTSTQNLFDDKGNPLNDEKDRVWAKNLVIDLGHNQHQHQYFIRTYNNIPLDPMGPEAGRDIWRRTELKSVSQKTFDYYMLYLRSKNGLYMTRAQRSFING
jgi:hypothetical protein